MKIEPNNIYHGNCLDLMNYIKSGSIHLIFADLPFNTTAAKWDILIPLNKYVLNNKNKPIYEFEFIFESMKQGFTYQYSLDKFNSESNDGLWQHYERIITDNGVMLLFGQEPFSSLLRTSNPKLYRYDWIIEKTSATGFLNANKMPMKAHEKISVFYKKLPTYNPIKTTGHIRRVSSAEHKMKTKSGGKSDLYHIQHNFTDYDSTDRFPRDVIKYKWDKQISRLHPCQKPVKMLEDFIETYSNENDIMLDNVIGASSSIIAAINKKRRYIGIEKEKKYFDLSIERIKNHLDKINNIK